MLSIVLFASADDFVLWAWEIYSGDVDVIVSVTSTRYSIDAMNLKVIKPWHPWLDLSNEVVSIPTSSL